jgi:hypothetical protein
MADTADLVVLGGWYGSGQKVTLFFIVFLWYFYGEMSDLLVGVLVSTYKSG